MIDELAAYDVALTKFSAFYKDAAARNPRLEEIEVTDDNKYWLVTLSFLEFPETESKWKPGPVPAKTGIASLDMAGGRIVIEHKPSRLLRTFKVDAGTGKLRGMVHPEAAGLGS